MGLVIAQTTDSPTMDLGAFHKVLTWWSAFYEQWGHTMENCIVTLLILTAGWLVHSASQAPFWRDAAKQVFRNKRALVSFVILFAYLMVGLFDSIAWRDVAKDRSDKPLRLASGKPVLEARGLSLLDRFDRVTLNLQGKEERTYSSPFAARTFTRHTASTTDDSAARIHPPLRFSRNHPLGTDQVGTDVLYKSIKSIRTALIISGMTTLIAIPFAVFFGVQAGYFGKRVDDIITYFYSTLASIPSILLIIAFVLTFGRGLFQLCVIMGITTWTGLCRVIRGEVLKLREMDYVLGARAIGSSAWNIQIKHIVPNVMHLVVIRTVLMFSGLVLVEAVLSYLNVGVGPGTMSWGTMINQGRFELSRQPIIWWNLVAAFVFMFGLVMPANVFGDAVRDALDPRLIGTDEPIRD